MTQTKSASAAPAARDYPPADSRPEPVEFGGGAVRYTDPFRWLEEESDPEVTSWQDAQDRFTQHYLTALPGFAKFAGRVAAIGSTEDANVPHFAGGRWFRTYVPEGEDLSVAEVSDSPTAPGRRIIDLNAMRDHEPLALSAFIPSPDGRKVLFSWAAGGREEPHVRVIDVDSGKILLDGIPHKRPAFIAWQPDSEGVFYCNADGIKSELVRLTLDAPTQPATATIELRHPVVRPFAAADRRHMLLFVDHLAPRPDYILDLQGDGMWKPFLKEIPGIFRGDIIGEHFIAITDDVDSRGRLVSIPLATPTRRETWKEIVAPSDDILASVVVTANRAVLLDLVDTYARLRVFGADGSFEGEIALPDRGMVNTFGSFYSIFNMVDPIRRAEDGKIIFTFASFGQSYALHSADLVTRNVTRLSAPLHTQQVQVLDRAAKSADGERVVYHVVAKRGLDLAKKHPTVITGYGGFNVAVLPGWLGTIWAAWIEAGGVIVLGHLRGGGEFGSGWWETGRLEHKQNSFNDVFAIAEDMIADGLATPERIGVIGGSNGGVMAAAVAVQRPDLFRASVPQVPISDLLARVRDPVTMVSTLDYGDPNDPAMAKILYAWSPYQNVRDGVAYPAMLLDSGANDPRCPPWHSRKLAARLQQASSSQHPILLRVRAGAGHGAVGNDARNHQSAEILAFFAAQLGLAV